MLKQEAAPGFPVLSFVPISCVLKTGIAGPHLTEKRTGVVMVRWTPGGGAGTGEAWRTITSTAWSRSGKPDERASETAPTCPPSSMEKRTYTVPRSPRAFAPGG